MAARIAGSTSTSTIVRHLLPSFMSYLIVSPTLSIPGMILGETALSFLGLRPPTVSWGVLLKEAQNVLTIALHPWMMIPGVLVMALLLTDLNGDGRLDMMIGNDFELPDYVFLWTPDGFRLDDVLPRMPRNTMSLDAAGIDNDGRFELFSADMKPYADDAATRDPWQTLAQNYDALPAGDPHIEENVLLVGTVADGFENHAADSGSTPAAGAGRPSSRTWTTTPAGSVRRQRHIQRGFLRAPARRRADRAQPGVPQRGRRQLSPRRGVGAR